MNELLIRYIAMNSEQARIRFMQSWLKQCFSGSNVQRTVGTVIGDPLSSKHYDHKTRLSRFGYGLTRSEVGCFLSHRECWQECLQTDKPVLVLESDVFPLDLSKFRLLLFNILEIERKFDVVRLHGVFRNNETFARQLATVQPGLTLVQTLGDPMGSAAYLVKPNAAGELLRASESFFQPVDVFLASTWLHKQRFRSVKPWPMVSQDFPSEIGERRRPKQSLKQRMLIEMNRAKDDIRRICYLPRHFFR